MPRRASTALAQQLVDAATSLYNAKNALYAYGDVEAAQAAERALRELNTPAVNAIVVQAGGTSGTIRP